MKRQTSARLALTDEELDARRCKASRGGMSKAQLSQALAGDNSLVVKIKRQRHDLWSRVGTTINLEGPNAGDDKFEWHVCDFGAMLNEVIGQSSYMQNITERAFQAHPSTEETKWQLLLQAEEATPGAASGLDIPGRENL